MKLTIHSYITLDIDFDDCLFENNIHLNELEDYKFNELFEYEHNDEFEYMFSVNIPQNTYFLDKIEDRIINEIIEREFSETEWIDGFEFLDKYGVKYHKHYELIISGTTKED